MADSDDYFSDDLVLDAQVLAVLDEEESKFKHTQSPGAGDAPPAKRQKTASGWQSRRNVKRDETLDDMDDLPEISIRNDGTYGVGSSAGQPVSSTKVVVESNSQTHIALGANHTGYTSQSRHFVPSQPERTSFSSAANHGPMPTRRVPQRHASNPRPARPSPSPIAISIPPPSNHANESPLSKMIETMQREMEEVRILQCSVKCRKIYLYSINVFFSCATQI
ncbi:hypothetical protein BJ138DRAFT_794809 [Hygrophoropsis aurantiaca]|uniref:Uncharacterized protein n=1 Tax=Hygrophoropsis aurantiaca TaxID=72124 RepID=A0ACB8AGX4_9AGAM|nr:hypothetical protein BJ138DRAFT_794809 [Hygrophoropsis aurantiaca]